MFLKSPIISILEMKILSKLNRNCLGTEGGTIHCRMIIGLWAKHSIVLAFMDLPFLLHVKCSLHALCDRWDGRIHFLGRIYTVTTWTLECSTDKGFLTMLRSCISFDFVSSIFSVIVNTTCMYLEYEFCLISYSYDSPITSYVSVQKCYWKNKLVHLNNKKLTTTSLQLWFYISCNCNNCALQIVNIIFIMKLETHFDFDVPKFIQQHWSYQSQISFSE